MQKSGDAARPAIHGAVGLSAWGYSETRELFVHDTTIGFSVSIQG